MATEVFSDLSGMRAHGTSDEIMGSSLTHEMGGLPTSWWAIVAARCRGQYGHGAPVPLGAVGAAARFVACDAGENGVCRFDHGGLRFGHGQCGPRGSKARPFMGCREQTIVPDVLEACGSTWRMKRPMNSLTGGVTVRLCPGRLSLTRICIWSCWLLRMRSFEMAIPVGVARQLVQHLGRPTGGLGIDHPVVGQQGLAACPPGRGRGLGIVGNCPVLSGLIQRVEKLAPELARGGLDRRDRGPVPSNGRPPPLAPSTPFRRQSPSPRQPVTPLQAPHETAPHIRLASRPDPASVRAQP